MEYYDKHSEKEVCFCFFADVEKAFGNLNWESMLLTMQKMQFGTDFISVIEAIYKMQQSSVKIENELTRGKN